MTAPKRILIAEISPLQRLAAAGESALDRLFENAAELWVADLVVDEIMRSEAETETLRAWFGKNRERIRILETDDGAEYKKAITAWRRVPGSPPELRPKTRRMEVLSALDAAEKSATNGDVTVVVDDRKIAAAIDAMGDRRIEIATR